MTSEYQSAFIDMAGQTIGRWSVVRHDGYNKRGTHNGGAMSLIVIESPYAGDIERNTIYARRAMRDCFERGEQPFASHLLYTQPGVLDENDPEERKRGIEAGYEWWGCVTKIAFYVDYGFSGGMIAAFERALKEKDELKIEIRKIGVNP